MLCAIGRLHDDADWQVELAREFEVALIVCGHSHDSARAIRHQHVIGDPDRDALAVDGIDGIAAREDARFGAGSFLTLAPAFFLGCGNVGFDLGAMLGCRNPLDQGMFRRKHHEGRPPQGIGARCKDFDTPL